MGAGLNRKVLVVDRQGCTWVPVGDGHTSMGCGRGLLRRSVLIKLNYLHVCTPAYCLLHRATCRFFFPWPRQPHQVYVDNTQRLAPRRRLVDDDQWVVPHNLLLTVFSNASVNVIGLDLNRNVDQARSYASKCGSKLSCSGARTLGTPERGEREGLASTAKARSRRSGTTWKRRSRRTRTV